MRDGVYRFSVRVPEYTRKPIVASVDGCAPVVDVGCVVAGRVVGEHVQPHCGWVFRDWIRGLLVRDLRRA